MCDFANRENDPKLQQYGRPRACPGGDEENDPEFYSDLVGTLAQFDEERAIPALVGAINIDSAEQALVKYESKALGPVLEQLRNQNEWTRRTALQVGIRLLEIHDWPDTRATIREFIRSALADPASIVRSQAVEEIPCLSGRQEYVSMLKGVAKKDPLKLPSKADDGGDGENFYPVRYDARRHASKRGRKRPETIYFLGFTLYCTRNRKGNFRVGLRTEKSRLRRALMRLQDQMRRMRHSSIQEQTDGLNQMLRGHYAYYGIAGNIRALQRVHRAVERDWRKMLSSRSGQGKVWGKQFQQIKERFPLLRPKLHLSYSELQAIAAR